MRTKEQENRRTASKSISKHMNSLNSEFLDENRFSRVCANELVRDVMAQISPRLTETR